MRFILPQLDDRCRSSGRREHSATGCPNRKHSRLAIAIHSGRGARSCSVSVASQLNLSNFRPLRCIR